MKLLKLPNLLWIAEQRGPAVFIVAGRAGSPGVPKVREFRSNDVAAAYLQKQRTRRLDDGYVVIDEDGGLSDPFTVDGASPAPPAVPRRHAHLVEAIRTQVRGGFVGRAGLDRMLDELAQQGLERDDARMGRSLDPDEAPDRDGGTDRSRAGPRSLRVALHAAMRREIEEVRASVRPSPCVNDAIDRAFEELDPLGVIALQNAGLTQSDGWEEVNQVALERGGPWKGGCFYHSQDLERAVRGEGLQLSFSAFGTVERPSAGYFDLRTGSTDAESVAVGQIVVDVLHRHRVDVVWNGTFRQRIAIRPFVWYRTSPA